ncbi:hypothetical protein ACFVYC_13290 [Pseudarthrobacter sp. NPDC058329]|uniref:hypothetical protein n=1 Tax=Pseudarthrobacter sp. NPDC058329 TaxID=3346448 RepID=UPI0036DF67F8
MTKEGPPSGASTEDEPDPAGPSLGTLVIRTWNEPDQTPPFRARVTYSHSASAEPKTVYTADPLEVVGLVRQWLTSQSEGPLEH